MFTTNCRTSATTRIVCEFGPVFTLIVLSVVTVHATAQGQSLFISDDFADGDLGDNSPVSWRTVWTPTLATSDDGLVMGDPTGPAALVVDGLSIGDVSVRTQARHREGVFGVAARFLQSGGNSFYTAWVESTADGGAGLGVRAQMQGDRVFEDLVPVPVDLSQDVLIQMDAFGTSIDVWAWQPDVFVPEAPQVRVELEPTDSLGEGEVGVFVTPDGPSAEAIFRLVQISDTPLAGGGDLGEVDLIYVPEPTNLVLAMLGWIAIVCFSSLRSSGPGRRYR